MIEEYHSQPYSEERKEKMKKRHASAAAKHKAYRKRVAAKKRVTAALRKANKELEQQSREEYFGGYERDVFGKILKKTRRGVEIEEKAAFSMSNPEKAAWIRKQQREESSIVMGLAMIISYILYLFVKNCLEGAALMNAENKVF